MTKEVSTTNMANDSNPASWYKENNCLRYKFNRTIIEQGIIIVQLNINALVKKVDEVKSILDECSFDILFLAETKLNNQIKQLDYTERQVKKWWRNYGICEI